MAAAVPLAARAEPALNPNQPNHSRPTPSNTSGRLCGRMASFLKPRRGPSTSARARADDTGHDLDDEAARVVEHAQLGQPAAGAPHPVRDNRIHDDRPHRDEHHPGGELRAVGDRAADQRGRDDRERQLERGVQQLGNRAVGGVRGDAEHADMPEVAEEPARPVLGERDGVTEQQPRHRDQRYGDEAHHDHVEHPGGADHAAVEDRQAGGHQQNQCGAGQQPRGGGGVDRMHDVGSFDSAILRSQGHRDTAMEVAAGRFGGWPQASC